MRAYDIAAYTFRADIWCRECVIEALPTGPGEAFDGWAETGSLRMATEDNLSELAYAFGINRADENTFDSYDFPKVIFASQLDGFEYCAGCSVEL